MVLLLVLIFFDALEHRSVIHAHALHQCRQILHIEVAIRAPMSLSRAWGMLRENLLTAKGAISTTPPVRITTHVAIDVPNVVSVFFIEGIIRELVETAPPE